MPSGPAAQAAPQRSERSDRGRGGDHRGDRGPRGRRRTQENDGDRDNGFVEKTIFINRSAKVVKGGRRFSFSALVVVGDKQGRVGLGLGKGNEVSDAIRKGGENAKSHLLAVALKDKTIPHEVLAEFDGARVLLRPASPGTGLICGKTVRAVVESAGVRDLLSKSLGSKNPANVAKATLDALLQLRRREEILKSRGLETRLSPAV
ncbi:MAG: 30S ribosomal protein S5 [Verrucomicrobia bacterium]|nr:30S ribosomal protein S5 [Verrucomicrobiota bacterium]